MNGKSMSKIYGLVWALTAGCKTGKMFQLEKVDQ